MAYITIDVAPDPFGSRYFQVTIKRGKEILTYWNVPTEEQGKEEVLAEIARIGKMRNPDIE